MSNIGSVVRPEDAKFHRPAYRVDTWCETNWFGFTIPEEKMRGSAYALFRSNLGVCRSSMQVYSQRRRHVLAMDYQRDDFYIPIPSTGNLDDFRLANGLRVKMTKPMEEWIVQFDDGRGHRWDLVQTALMPPVSVTELTVPDSGAGYAIFHRHDADSMVTGHIDQTMHVQGEVLLGGRTLTVDFPSNRDHSWSPRREFGHNVMGNFDEAHFSLERSFLLQTRNDELECGTLTHGYLREGREVIPFKAGVGRYEFDGWVIQALEYELEDAKGRTHRLLGEPVSYSESYQANAFSMTGVVRWTLEGETGWGDFKWHWDVQRMQAAVRDGVFKLPG